MKITGLDGKQYSWNPSQSAHPRISTSKYHESAKKIIEEIYLFDHIYEEVELVGTKTKGQNLTADFCIPSQRTIIEVHGEQHYARSFFHKNELEFKQSQLRDKNKERWCTINNFKLIVLPYYEKEQDWRSNIERTRKS